MGKVAILAGKGDIGWGFAKLMVTLYPSRVAFIEQDCESVVLTELCKDNNVPCFNHINEDLTLERIKDFHATTIVLAWWPRLVKELNKLDVNLINTHPSYLPYNRGKHGYSWAIMEGTPFGVSIHRLGDGIDDGPILWRKKIELTPLDTGQTSYNKSFNAMYELLSEHAEDIANENFPDAIEQDEAIATHRYAKEFDLPPIQSNDIFNGHELINDCRARTFNNSHSGRKIEIDGKVYRIHLHLVEEK